jgi:hypothetical protein
MAEETMPSPAPLPPVEEKLRGVLGAMTEAVNALLSSTDPGRFGRASRLCVMGQKISIEIVTSVREAKMLRQADQQQILLGGGLGPEGQYIAQEGGDVEGYIADQQDYNIMHGVAPRFVGMGAMQRPNDAATLQRDLMTMLQGYLSDQKKTQDKATEPSRFALYAEFNELIRTRNALSDPKDAALLIRVEKQIDSLIDLIATKDSHDAPSPDTHLVPAELLRGHPPRASEQWGDASRDSRPVLHREGSDEGPAGGGEAERPNEIAVG